MTITSHHFISVASVVNVTIMGVKSDKHIGITELTNRDEVVSQIRKFVAAAGIGWDVRKWELVGTSGTNDGFVSNLHLHPIISWFMLSTIECFIGKMMTGTGVNDGGRIFVDVVVAKH